MFIRSSLAAAVVVVVVRRCCCQNHPPSVTDGETKPRETGPDGGIDKRKDPRGKSEEKNENGRNTHFALAGEVHARIHTLDPTYPAITQASPYILLRTVIRTARPENAREIARLTVETVAPDVDDDDYPSIHRKSFPSY